jgi:pimeloyl-ACP methyl ester carboxylesterase
MSMEPTTVVFVHGFDSDPDCWIPLRTALEKDGELAARGYRLLWNFGYPTKIMQLVLTRRIPSVFECGAYLRDFVERNVPEGRIMLVGHSMGGLVIQAYLAGKINDQRGDDLKRIRTVVTLATPNRGATILSAVRKMFTWISDNPQDDELQVLNKEIADMSDTIVRSVLGAENVDPCSCPIPFRVFWGMEDDVVPEVSARGPFAEASPLEGTHHTILEPDPKIPDDARMVQVKSALLDPVGHPGIYELDLWETNLTVSPNDPAKAIVLHGFDDPIQVQTDNIAVRQMNFVFSRQNRCAKPWDQMYRSKQGYVQLLTLTGDNEADDAEMSEYVETAKRFTYVFTPAITSSQTETYAERLRIYNGFGDGERNWHDHLKPNARCKLYRIVLNLKEFGTAGYSLTVPPALHFINQDVMDHSLCDSYDGLPPLPPLPGTDSWVSTWEIENVHGGVVDLAWEVKKPA